MSDKEILNSLNNDSRKYINDFYSFLNFFSNNSKRKYENEELITVCAFLSSLKNDDIIKEYFNRYDINYEKMKKGYKLYNDIDFDRDINFIDITQQSILTEISLSKIFTEVLIKLKYSNYLENVNIPLNEIDPYQIFDGLTKENRDILYDNIMAYANIKDDELMLNLSNYLYDYYYDFAYSYGIDIASEAEYELTSSKSYDFKNSIRK